MVHVVAYDLKKPHETWRDYQRLWDALRGYGYYCHLEESVWLIKTEQTTVQVRDYFGSLCTRATNSSSHNCKGT